MTEIKGKLTIRTFTFGDLTVFEIPQNNYDPAIEIDMHYRYYVQYHNPRGFSLEFICGMVERMKPEEVIERYRAGFFNYHQCYDCHGCDCEDEEY